MAKFLYTFLNIILLSQTFGNSFDCDLSYGGRGFCVSFKNCDLTNRKNSFFYNEDFCTEDHSKICCKTQIEESKTETVDYYYDDDESNDEINSSSILSAPLESDYLKNHKNYNLLDLKKCGITSLTKRISGGERARVLEFPWVALIGYQVKDEIKFLCGGSLISDNYVVTASHCVSNHFNKVKKALRLVRLGEHTQSNVTDCDEVEEEITCADPVQDIPINSTNCIMHQDFQYQNRKNDIALIRLSEFAKISQNNIKPICMPFDPQPFRSKMTVIGFGRTNANNWDVSYVLMKVVIELRENEDCNKILKLTDPLLLDDKQLCAGDTRNNCKGDSGSSLEGVGEYENRVQLYGIVSYGSSCSNGKGEPGVYARVHSYLPWILDNMRQT